MGALNHSADTIHHSSSTLNHFDTIVIGVGSMGAAACYHLAARGQKVLGLEQFTTPHDKGSHAGHTRIIRKAYFEHPDYVPLLGRAYENWRGLESESGVQLYFDTGIVYFGRSQNENIRGIRHSAKVHGISIENIGRTEAVKRFPSFSIPPDFDTIYEADAGFVTPERAIEAYVRLAEKHGAIIQTNTVASGWRQEGNKIRVTTGALVFTADKLVITAGAWTSGLLPESVVPLRVTRQLLAWITPPDPASFYSKDFPCWFIEDPELGTFYGFPIHNHAGGMSGLKLAHHHPGIPCDADEISRPIPGETEKLRNFLRKYVPSAGEEIAFTKHCLYTYSPDAHFVIDHLPDYSHKVVVACGFSGHGFKFVPVVGEVLADLVTNGRTDLPIDFLRMNRFH